MKPFYLYKIINSVNDKIYVGITSRPKERMREHKSKTSKCSKLRKAMDKHGRENFSMEILCIGSEDYILELELKYTQLYNCVESGYNIIYGHPNKLGVSMPEETKKAMSQSLLKFYKENPNYLKENRKPRGPKIEPNYVSGFWFPSKHAALAALCMNEKSFYKRIKEGTAGEVCHPQPKSKILSHSPVYILGFWFNSLLAAEHILNKPLNHLQLLVKKCDVEQELKVVGSKPRKKSVEAYIGVNQYNNETPRAVLIKNGIKVLNKRFKTELEAAIAYDDCYEEIHGDRPNKTIREDSRNNTEAIDIWLATSSETIALTTLLS